MHATQNCNADGNQIGSISTLNCCKSASKSALPVMYRSQGCHELTSKSKYSLSLPYFALTGPENLQRTYKLHVGLL